MKIKIKKSILRTIIILSLIIIIGSIFVYFYFRDSLCCVITGGTWKQFNNSCVDNCDNIINPHRLCTVATTRGCDCGVNECWDGNNCKLNTQFEGGGTTDLVGDFAIVITPEH